MKESELAFWQKTARHYTRSMDRSAPLYAAVCERIRPHLSRDMNVLELACGTGQLSFPLSPYVRLWEATDAAPAMIQEAKKRIGSSRLHFSVQDAAHLPYAPESFDAVVIANALHILPEPDRVLREIQRVLKPGGWASHLVYGANRFPCLPPLERWRVCLLSVHARFLGSGARTAGRPCAAPLLRRLPVDTGGTDHRAEQE